MTPPDSSPLRPDVLAAASGAGTNAAADGSALGRPFAPAEAVIESELAVADVWSTEAVGVRRDGVRRSPSAAHAIGEAADCASRGGRAAVLIGAHEILGAAAAVHAAAAARAPVNIVIVGPPAVSAWDDLAAALDLGAGVFVTWSVQDAVDATVALHRAAEDGETPFLHIVDAKRDYAVLVPQDVAKLFVTVERNRAARADLAARERKRAERTYCSRMPFALGSALRALAERTGRALAPIERFETADAEEIIIAFGCAFVPARAVASEQRKAGKRMGVIGLRALRPFFDVDVVKAAARAKAVVVVEPLDVALAPCGPIAASVKAAFADALTWAPGFPGVGRIPPIVSAGFATMEDDGVTEAHIRAALAEIAAGDRARRLVVFGSDS